MKFFYFTLFVFVFQSLLSISAHAQCTCTQAWPIVRIPTVPPSCQDLAGANFAPTGDEFVDLVFDSFGKMTGGLTGSTTLRLRVPQLPVVPTCRWSLYMYIDNDEEIAAANTDWANRVEYGTGSAPPQLNLLEVRVSNGCGTPCNNGITQSFAVADKSCIPIISDLTANIPILSCMDNVNGPGDYLTSFHEYTFIIDYKIVPLPAPPAAPLSIRPGIWTVKIHFELIEEN